MFDKFRKTIIILTPFILLLLALVISIIPDLYRLSITPTGKTFPLIHNHITDYYYYLSLMHQGYEGNWLLTSRMTPENFPPVFAQTFFVILGQLSRIGNISLVSIYFLSRVIFAILLMLTVINIIKTFFKSNKHIILASFLVFFSTGFWTITNTSGQLSINQFLTFWTRMDPILRTTYLPHHLASTILGFFSLILLSQGLDKSNIKKIILAGVSGLLAGLIYFASMVNILGGVAIIFLAFLCISLIKKPRQTFGKIPPFLIYFGISLLSFLYLLGLARTIFPWSTYTTAGEKFTFGFFVSEYIGALGPTLMLSLLGVGFILKGKTWLPKFLLGWAIFPFVGLLFINKIYWQFADIYYLEAATYIPLGILSAYGWKVLEQRIFQKIKGSAVIFAIILLIYFIPPIVFSFQKELSRFTPYYYNHYIPNEVLDGIKWLDTYTPKESVVLAGGYFGSIIPAYSHNRVVYGHPANTYKAAVKSQETDLFFSQKDASLSAEILRKYNVSYVFYALDNDPPSREFIQSLRLRGVFENNIVKIFKIDK